MRRSRCKPRSKTAGVEMRMSKHPLESVATRTAMNMKRQYTSRSYARARTSAFVSFKGMGSRAR